MKKTVPFNFFEEGQTIYFDIKRLAELEQVMGIPITSIAALHSTSAKFCLAGLRVGLQHHFSSGTSDLFADKIDECFEKGTTLDQLVVPIIQAIYESGVFGKAKNDNKESVEEKNE